MNYSHSYHAGHFADVFKHMILVSLIKSLLRKENGFCYLDTHAGPGYYDLFAEEAQKTKAFETGITKVINQKNPPDLVRQYLNCVQRINSRLSKSLIASLRFYPGSPAIVGYFLRAQDRMILSELHPQEFRLLKNNFANNKHAITQMMDGYQSLKAFLPPKERRGLILIDPPFERPNEFAYLVSVLPQALKRFATGIYAIWFPIKDRPPIERFYKLLKENIQLPMLAAELSVYPETSAQHLNGSGMVIINPPWQLDQQLKEALPWLLKVLSVHGQGQQRVFSLTEKNNNSKQ